MDLLYGSLGIKKFRLLIFLKMFNNNFSAVNFFQFFVNKTPDPVLDTNVGSGSGLHKSGSETLVLCHKVFITGLSARK